MYIDSRQSVLSTLYIFIPKTFTTVGDTVLQTEPEPRLPGCGPYCQSLWKVTIEYGGNGTREVETDGPHSHT